MEPGRRPEELRCCGEAELRPSPAHCRELLRLRLAEVLEMLAEDELRARPGKDDRRWRSSGSGSATS